MLDKFKFFKDKDKSKTGGAKAAPSGKGANAKAKDKRLSDEGGAGPSVAATPQDSKLPNGNVSRLAVSEAGAAGGRESPKPGKEVKEKKSSKLSLGSKSKKQEVANGATTTSQTESQLQKRGAIPTSKSVSGSLLKKANGSTSAKLQPSSSTQAKLDKSAAAQRESSPSQTKKGVTKIAGINKANLSGKTKSSASSSAGSTLSLGGSSSASSGIPTPGIPKPGIRSSSKPVSKDEAKTRSVSREKSRDQLTKRESGSSEAQAEGRPMSPMGRAVTQKQQQQLQQQQHQLQQQRLQQQQQALQQQKAQQEQQRRSGSSSTGHYGIRPGDASAQAHAQAVAQHHAAQQQQAKQFQQQQMQEHAKQQQVQQQQQLQHQLLQQQQQQQQQQRLSHGSMIAMGKHAKTAHPSKISQGFSQHSQSPSANTHPQVSMVSPQQNIMSQQSRTPKMATPAAGGKPMKVDSDTQTNVSAINRVITPSKNALTKGINASGSQTTGAKVPNKDQSSHSLTSNDSATVSSGGESGGNSHSTSNSNNSRSSNDSVIFRPSTADEGESGLESDSNKSGHGQIVMQQQQMARPPVQDHISSLRKNSANTQGRSIPMSPQSSKMETTFGPGDIRTERKNVHQNKHTNSPKETTFVEKDESDDVLIQNIKPMQPILRASPYAYLNIGKSNALPRPSFHISTTLSSQVSNLAHSQSASSRLGVNRPLIDPSKYSLTHLNLKRSALSSSRSVQDDDCASDADSADLAAGYMSDGDILRSNHLDDINRYFCILPGNPLRNMQ